MIRSPPGNASQTPAAYIMPALCKGARNAMSDTRSSNPDPSTLPPAQAEHYRRLQWHCRRGIKEVEVLLLPFFAHRYLALPPEDQARFEKLLEQEDVEMFDWFTYRSRPQDPDLLRIVTLVLNGVDA